ncbi:MAG TPA: hypothetical protein DEF51_12560 [Myxococcales bacterium]|nr:hypothetical protein [Myxococcales bacterium]
MTPSRSTLSRLALCLCLAAFAGCGGGGPIVRDVTPFTAEHEPAFENGLDMVRDPEALGGAWLRTWEDEIDRRVSLADVVALVTVKTFRTDVDLERNETYRLVTQVDREYLGELEDEVVLSVSASEAGFGTISDNERRILDTQFIAFIKFQESADGTVRPRWHLSPASEPVARRVRDLLRTRRDVVEDDGTRRRVIVHRN